MSLSTILITAVGSGIAKGILNIWLEEHTFAKEIGKNFASIIASKTNDVLAQRMGNRQFERISEKVAENLLPIFNASSISEERKIEIAQLTGTAIDTLKISSDLLVARNLDPKQIEVLLLNEAHFPNEENPLINFTEEDKELYKRVISESAQYIVDIASNLPNFNERTFAEVLKREDAILAKAEAILEEVKKMRENTESSDDKAREFEINYRRAVVRKLDELELFGVDLSSTSKRYRLSVAYVTLSVEYSGNSNGNEPQKEPFPSDEPNDEDKIETTELLSIDEAICKSNRLLLRGAAGSGKTTLMKWVAVMSAGNSLEDGLEEWNQCVPFFIRLREFSDKTLPTPNAFPALITPALSDEMPEQWVIGKLKAGQAIILVDGVDEIAEGQRENIKTWLKDIDDNYPNNKWILTSRLYAAEKGWLADAGFMDADLQDMNVKNVESFIKHWHEAVKGAESQLEKKEQLDNLEAKLKATIKENRNLRKLATNPLLCAMICALHRDRNTKLPSDRIQLYEACIDMFFRRDQERNVDLDDYIEIGDRQKKILLADFAYWLIKNNLSEVEIERADDKFGKKIPALRDIPTNTMGADIRKYFVERSGVLRQPTSNTIDFPHRTFEEYLAAKAIIDADELDFMVGNSTNDQWREVIQLACGLATPKNANKVIKDILKLGDEQTEKKAAIHLLAVACLETIMEIDEEIEQEVQKRLQALVPPKNVEAAKELAKAGDLVVPYLRYDKKRNIKEATACIRTLSMIKEGEKALSILKDYCKDERKGVQDAVIDGVKHWDRPEEYLKELKFNHKYIYVDKNMPIEVINSLPQLEYIKLGRKSREDFKFLNSIKKLKRLQISDAQFSDLSLISSLTHLLHLDLHYTKVNTLRPISNLVELRSMDIRSTLVRDLNPILNFKRLNKLALPRVFDLKPILNLPNLTSLNIDVTRTDIKVISNLTKLRELIMNGNSVDDLSPISNLTGLRNLSLLWMRVSDLSPIASLSNLTNLNISGTQVNDLKPISSLSNLRYLNISRVRVDDLEPISGLVKLKYLIMSKDQKEKLPLPPSLRHVDVYLW